MKIKICDICGKKMKSEEKFSSIFNSSIFIRAGYKNYALEFSQTSDDSTPDICDDCKGKINQSIEETVEVLER